MAGDILIKPPGKIVQSSDIDHNQTTNYDVAEHRTINDSGTGATELWSASKINTDLSGKANTVHTHTESDITDLDHTDTDAIHDNVAGEINAIAEKVTPVNADIIIIEDSADSNNKKKAQIGNLPAAGLPAGVVTVASSGGDYTTVQAALNANATAVTILVYPGTYTDTINFTANDQVVMGLNGVKRTIIQQTSANIASFASYTGCRIRNITLEVTGATTAIDMVDGVDMYIDECILELTCSTAIVAAQQPSLVTSTGNMYLINNELIYTHTGACGSTAIKTAIRPQASSWLYADNNRFTVTGGGTGGWITCYYSFATGNVKWFRNSIVVMDDITTDNMTAAFITGIGVPPTYFIHNTVELGPYTTSNNHYGVVFYSSGITQCFSEHNNFYINKLTGYAYGGYGNVFVYGSYDTHKGTTSASSAISGGPTFTNLSYVRNGSFYINNILYPTSSGSNGDVLTSNGSGTATFQTPSTTTFGTNYYQANSAGLSSYLGVTPQQKVVLSQSVSAGNYICVWSAQIYVTGGYAIAEARQGAITVKKTIWEPNIYWRSLCNVQQIVHAGGTLQLTIYYYSNNSSSTAHIQNAHVMFWRAS